MINIAIGGHLEKKQIAELIDKHGEGKIKSEIMTDMGGAMAVKNNKADYYIGACNTGGGGAVALAIGLLGAGMCEIVSRAGRPASYDDICALLGKGKKAFGMTQEHVGIIVPNIVKAILAKNE